MVKEITSILGLILGFILANKYCSLVSLYIVQILGVEQYAHIVSYILIFIITLSMVIVIGLALRKFMQKIMLGWLDKLGGGVFGFIKGTLICCLILLFFTMLLPAQSKALSQSKISPFLQRLTKNISDLIPETLKVVYQNKTKRLEQTWQNESSKTKSKE